MREIIPVCAGLALLGASLSAPAFAGVCNSIRAPLSRTTDGAVVAPPGYRGPSANTLRGAVMGWLMNEYDDPPFIVDMRDDATEGGIQLVFLKTGQAFLLGKNKWALRSFFYLPEMRKVRDRDGTEREVLRPKESDLYEGDFELAMVSGALKVIGVRLVAINGKTVFTRTPPGQPIP